MISIGLRDFRGCERADLVCAPIALVAGLNATGKSSIAQATGAALCGKLLPFAGLTKAGAGMLIKLGGNSARIEIKHESGTCRVEWPTCQATTQGEPPHASVFAAGLDSIALQAPKDRAQILGETYLHAAPTREELAQALSDVELGQEPVVEVVWKLIEDQGWDGAHSLRKETGAELKGRWRQITGKTYGSRVAASWAPEGWQFELEPAKENDLMAAVVRTRDVHEKAIAAAAVSAADRQRLADAAAQLEARIEALREAEIEEARLEEELRKAETSRAALPSGTTGPEMPCPHCGGLVVLRQVSLVETRLEAAETIPAAQLKKRRLAIADADGAIGRLSGQLAQQRRDVIDPARALMQNAAEARAKLGQAPPAAEGGSDVEAAKTDLAAAEKRLASFRQKRDADDLHAKIAGNDALLAILAPDGLRARKLGHVLDAFNRTQLADLAAAADWQAVTIDPEMTLAYGGRPYALCSTSEQYRVRAVLELAMARLDGSDMVVLDAADVLDGPTRSGLFQMLEEAGLPALVCMTLSRREQVPDLAAAELGASYWLADGVAQPLRALAEAAA